MKKILIIDSDVEQVSHYKSILADKYQIEHHSSLANIDQVLKKIDSFDCILADIHLHDGCLLNLLQTSYSKLTEFVPVIIASAEDKLDILKQAFKLGVVDYLVKPLNKSELLVKVDRGIRNSLHIQNMIEEMLENLTLIESKIFSVLLRFIGETVERDDLYRLIWKNVQVSPKTLDVHVSNLRKKTAHSPWMIEGVGSGWKLVNKSFEKA